jgi:hypothetical protein
MCFIFHDRDRHKVYVNTVPPLCRAEDRTTFDERIQLLVPPEHRWQNPITSRWEVSDTYLDEIISAGVYWFGQANVTSNMNPNAPPAVVTSTETPEDVIISLFKMVGPDKADSVYRNLSRVFHPDLGGSNKLMMTLNNARDKYLGKKN